MATTTITLSIDNLDSDRAALYHQYAGQYQPQPAYVEMTKDGIVSADWSGEIGSSTPMHVWHGRTLRWMVSSAVDCAALAEWLRGSGQELLERVHTGHTIEWDGNNQRGKLSDDAEVASQIIEGELKDLPTLEIWSVRDWLWTNNRLQSVWPADKSLDDAVAECEAEIEHYTEGVVTGDVREELLARAEFVLDTPRHHETMAQVHLDALVAAGKATQAQADEYAAEWLAA